MRLPVPIVLFCFIIFCCHKSVCAAFNVKCSHDNFEVLLVKWDSLQCWRKTKISFSRIIFTNFTRVLINSKKSSQRNKFLVNKGMCLFLGVGLLSLCFISVISGHSQSSWKGVTWICEDSSCVVYGRISLWRPLGQNFRISLWAFLSSHIHPLRLKGCNGTPQNLSHQEERKCRRELKELEKVVELMDQSF